MVHSVLNPRVRPLGLPPGGALDRQPPRRVLDGLSDVGLHLLAQEVLHHEGVAKGLGLGLVTRVLDEEAEFRVGDLVNVHVEVGDLHPPRRGLPVLDEDRDVRAHREHPALDQDHLVGPRKVRRDLVVVRPRGSPSLGGFVDVHPLVLAGITVGGTAAAAVLLVRGASLFTGVGIVDLEQQQH